MHADNATSPVRRKGLPLHLKVLVGFVLGAAIGLVVHVQGADAPWVQSLIAYVAKPFGQVFLNLLFMLVVPLMFSALVLGVAELGDIASLGRLGWRTLIYTGVVTAAAVAIGLIAVNVIQPGTHMSPALIQQAMSTNLAKASEIATQGNQLNIMDLLVNIVPHNIV